MEACLSFLWARKHARFHGDSKVDERVGQANFNFGDNKSRQQQQQQLQQKLSSVAQPKRLGWLESVWVHREKYIAC